MSKIFQVYWALGEENATIPDAWPQDLATHINHTNPLTVDFNETTSSVYLAVTKFFKINLISV
jgi:phospholipase D3/4